MITSPEIRLIDAEGNQAGIVSSEAALNAALEQGLDLVEIAPDAKPPVCKIMDYGKFKYLQAKKEHRSKQKQHVIHIKEIRLRPRIETHDFNVKLNHARKFLERKDKVQLTMQFRGREMQHTEFGYEKLKEFSDQLEEVAKIEQEPKREGKRIIMILSPVK